jgi:hypothetical protein
MGRPEVLDQSFTGLMLQLLKTGGLDRDLDRHWPGTGAEMIRRTGRSAWLQPELDLTHGVWPLSQNHPVRHRR